MERVKGRLADHVVTRRRSALEAWSGARDWLRRGAGPRHCAPGSANWLAGWRSVLACRPLARPKGAPLTSQSQIRQPWMATRVSVAGVRQIDARGSEPDVERLAATVSCPGRENRYERASAHHNGHSVGVSVTVDGVRSALSSVESAALSGVGAAALLSLSVYLLGRQPGVRSSAEDLTWYADSGNRFTVFVGLNLAALGVVAFLWFMAVIRRRLGEREDQFFTTVFLGSGFAFGLLTITAAVCAAAPTLVVHFGNLASLDESTVALAHGLWFGLWGVGASRLAGVFMAVTSTIGMRFDALPSWLSRLGLVLGALLGVTGAFAGPLDFLFTAWLAAVSLTLLFSRRRRGQARPASAR